MALDHNVNLRQANMSDAAALADLHIRAWQWAYQGLMPATFLVDLSASLEPRTEWWQRILSVEASEGRTWIVELNGQVVGFASTGPSGESDTTSTTAQLYAIYLDQQMAGHGIGRILLTHALSDLAGRGYDAACLWVLVTNDRARKFYEAAGWHLDGKTRIERQPAFELVETRYSIALSLVG